MAVVLSGVLLGLISGSAMASRALLPPFARGNFRGGGPDLSRSYPQPGGYAPGFEELQENQKEAMTTALGANRTVFGSGSRARTINATGYWKC